MRGNKHDILEQGWRSTVAHASRTNHNSPMGQPLTCLDIGNPGGHFAEWVMDHVLVGVTDRYIGLAVKIPEENRRRMSRFGQRILMVEGCDWCPTSGTYMAPWADLTIDIVHISSRVFYAAEVSRVAWFHLCPGGMAAWDAELRYIPESDEFSDGTILTTRHQIIMQKKDTACANVQE